MTERRRLTAADMALRLQNAEVRQLLADPKFLKFAFRFLATCGIHQPLTTSTAHATAYGAGLQAGGLNMISMLSAVEPDALVRILQAGQNGLLVQQSAETNNPAGAQDEPDDPLTDPL